MATRVALKQVVQKIRRWADAGEALPDRELLRRYLASKDEAAFAEIVERHGGMVLGICRRMLRQAQDAEDAFQATFLVLSRKAKSIRQQESLGGWLYGVAFRSAKKLRAKETRRREREAALWNGTCSVPSRVSSASNRTSSVPPDLSWQEVEDVVGEELNRLADKYRSPLLLCYLQGKTRDEAAQQLGWGLDVLRGRLERGRELLRARLTRRGLSLSAALLALGLTENAGAAGVSTGLVTATVKAACAASAAAAQAISPPVVALTQEVIQAMFMSKLKACVIGLVTVAFLGAGLSTLGNAATEHPALSSTSGASAAVSDGGGPQGGDPAKGPEKKDVEAKDKKANPLAVSFAGDRFAIAEDKTIRVFELKTGKELCRMIGHNDAVTTLAYSFDDKILASGGKDKAVCLWDGAAGRQLIKVNLPNAVKDVTFTPDGRRFVVREMDDTRREFDLATGREVKDNKEKDKEKDKEKAPKEGKVPAGNPRAVSGLLDKIAFAEDRTVRVFDFRTGGELFRMLGHTEAVTTLAFSPDGKFLVSGSKDKMVCVWDGGVGKQLRQFRLANAVKDVSFSQDGRTLVIRETDDTRREFDLATGAEVRVNREKK